MTNPVPVPAFGTPPAAPDPNNRPTYNADRAAMNFWMLGLNSTTGSNMVGLAQSAFTNATSASESAIAAAAAAAGANVELWDAVAVYSVGAVVISPAALAAGAGSVTYVCRAATGSTHIDPYSDPTHWAIFTVSGGVGGAVYTTSTTLSSDFSVVMRCDFAATVTLPSGLNGVGYHVKNEGLRDVKVIDGNGALLGFIPPSKSALISAVPQTGEVLSTGLSSAGVMVYINLSELGMQTISTCVVKSIDSSRLFCMVSNFLGVWVFVYNKYTGQKGAITSVSTPSGIYSITACGGVDVISANSVIFSVFRDSSNRNFEVKAAIATISDLNITNISYSSEKTGAGGNNYGGNGFKEIVKIGNYYITGFFRPNDGQFNYRCSLFAISTSPSLSIGDEFFVGYANGLTSSFGDFSLSGFGDYLSVSYPVSAASSKHIMQLISVNQSTGAMSFFLQNEQQDFRLSSNTAINTTVNSNSISVNVKYNASSFSTTISLATASSSVAPVFVKINDTAAAMIFGWNGSMYYSKLTISSTSVTASTPSQVSSLNGSTVIHPIAIIESHLIVATSDSSAVSWAFVSIDISTSTARTVSRQVMQAHWAALLNVAVSGKLKIIASGKSASTFIGAAVNFEKAQVVSGVSEMIGGVNLTADARYLKNSNGVVTAPSGNNLDIIMIGVREK